MVDRVFLGEKAQSSDIHAGNRSGHVRLYSSGGGMGCSGQLDANQPRWNRHVCRLM